MAVIGLTNNGYAQLLAMGGYDGINNNTYLSGADPANKVSVIMNFLKSFSNDYIYKDIAEQRLQLASKGSGMSMDDIAKINQGMTPEERHAYWNEENPTGGPQVKTSDVVKGGILATIPGIGPWVAGLPISSAASGNSWSFTDIPMNLIIIVVAILLLAVAAYSIVIPKEARSSIIKAAIA